jgi:hypothetical protein
LCGKGDLEVRTKVENESHVERKSAGLPGLWLVRPAALLRIEGAALLAASVVLYWLNGGSWWLFTLLLLTPDVSMLGYLFSSQIGAALYNAFHSYPLPVALGIFGSLWSTPLAVAIALVWLAHIGMDRLAGFGLKYPSGFKDTHLGRMN